jgi:alginate O-acetyltransferase complex protein AlgI
MSFTSGIYFVFLIAAFFAYWLTPARRRVALLLACNCAFYAYAGWKPLLLLAAVSAVDFTTTRLMGRTERRRTRRALLALSLGTGLGALGVFKYAGFFLDSAARGLALFGFELQPPQLSLIAPLGLSFFVFQSASHVIDVYRRAGAPAANLIEHCAFATFFPTIVAGPITRARQLLPQLRQQAVTLTPEQGGRGLFLIALGLVKKIAVADYLRANFVDRVFDFPERFSSLEVLAATYGYALQIYADFSGYSDIAIGSALLVGVALPANFDAPYTARDLPEFWRRWHITLSTWLRDYVFFSLTSLRPRSAGLMYVGLVVTMLAGGLWHGAAWTFVAWGLLHGVGLAAFRAVEAARKRWRLPRRNSPWARAAGVAVTFHFVCLTWVFFRAETFSQGWAMLRQLTALTTNAANLAPPVAFLIALGLSAHWMPQAWFESLQQGFTRLPAPAQAAILFGLACGLYFVASSDVVPFIYARF